MRAESFQIPVPEGHARVNIVETRVPGGEASLSYRTLSQAGVTPLKVQRHGLFYRMFGAQAPAWRGVLVVEAGGPADFSDRYPGHVAPHWEKFQVWDADAAEISVLRKLSAQTGLRHVNGRLLAPEHTDSLAHAVIARLEADQRQYFFPSGHSDMRNDNKLPDLVDLIVPISPVGGLISEDTRCDVAAFNGSFFILPEEEFIGDPFNRVMDPIGLVIEKGYVVSPPTYRRHALLVNRDGYPSVRPIGMGDVVCVVAGGLATVGGDQAVTRWAGWEATECAVDDEAAAWVVVVGRRIVALHDGEGRPHWIPTNGFILPIPASAVQAVKRNPTVTYVLRAQDYQAGCHIWMELARDGTPLPLDTWAGQHFRPAPMGQVDDGSIPPVYLQARYAQDTARAQTLVGWNKAGGLAVLVCDGTEPRSFDGEGESPGASLAVVRDVLLERGYTHIVALDGGGSSGLTCRGRLLSTHADRFDLRRLPQEREIAGAWTLQGGA